eukprot:scaffold1506_cov118-Isochrysis_galbana.AAC.3
MLYFLLFNSQNKAGAGWADGVTVWKYKRTVGRRRSPAHCLPAFVSLPRAPGRGVGRPPRLSY